MFDRESREIARARHLVGERLRSWGRHDEAPDVELLASELMSNALVHGSGRIGLWIGCTDDRIRLEVSDEGARTEPHLTRRPVGGWGLRFVDELADSWGSDAGAGGTVVWAVRGRSTASGGRSPGQSG